jgi:hypothetical protein
MVHLPTTGYMPRACAMAASCTLMKIACSNGWLIARRPGKFVACLHATFVQHCYRVLAVSNTALLTKNAAALLATLVQL